MITLTLSKATTLGSTSPVAPFVRAYLFTWTTQGWWETLGAPHETASEDPTILGVTIQGLVLTQASSLANVQVYESSWYYDTLTKCLYIHYPQDALPSNTWVSIGVAKGFCDGEIVYIDNTEYLPLLRSAPPLTRKEDTRGYSKPALCSGQAVLEALGGQLTELLSGELIGNTARLAYLPNDKVVDNQASSADLTTLATYYVEAYRHNPRQLTLRLQDPRKVTVKVPATAFNKTDYPSLSDSDDGRAIPLLYGPGRAVPAIPVDALATGSTSATFRAALLLTGIVAVQVKINDTWVSRTPSSTDLATGAFTIPNARASTTEAPYLCRVDCTGIAVTYASDIIKDLYSRYLGEAYNADNFDTVRWNREQIKLPPCSLYVGTQADLYTVINRVQNGIYPGFRFAIDPEGKKSITVDDRSRAFTFLAEAVDLQDVTEVEQELLSEDLASTIQVQYDKNWMEGTSRTKTVDTYAAEVLEKYQLQSTYTFDSLTVSPTTAQEMAEALAEDTKAPTTLISCTLVGEEYLDLQVYDVGLLAPWQGEEDLYNPPATPDFISPVYVQVLEVRPDLQERTCSIVGRVLDRVFTPLTTTYLMGSEQSNTLLLDSQGEAHLVDSDGNYIVSLDASEDVVNLVDSSGYFILGSG